MWQIKNKCAGYMKTFSFRLVTILIIGFFLVPIITTSGRAEEPICNGGADRACLLGILQDSAGKIEETSWRDQTWRETARLLARDGQPLAAAALVEQIENPDTKAMTIRGIGMEAARLEADTADLSALFVRLREEAEKIEHPPSYAIALTYIAMAQAFAGDDAGAMQTAAAMESSALRNKAYAETAEIQAERGDLDAALVSIAAIDSPAFTNKALYTIARIFTDRQSYANALQAGMKIDNDYQKAQSILYILAKQMTPEDTADTP